MSLKRQITSGVVWVFLDKLVGQGLMFLVFLIVVRLIGPEEYGLVGVCAIFAALTTLLLFGAGDAVVSKRLTDRDVLSTLFWSLFAMGLLLSAATFLLATPFSRWMEDERLEPLVRWLSLMPVLLSIPVVPAAILHARLEFRIFTVRSLAANLISGALGIYLAIQGFGAYALVAQQITTQIIGIAIIFPSARWFPSFTYNIRDLKKVLAPALKFGSVSILSFLEQQVPRIYINLLLGPVSVGYFAFITRLFQTLSQLTVVPLAMVFYPAMARIKDDTEQAGNALRQFIWVVGFLVLPVLVGAALTAPQFVPLFFGDKWIPAAPLVQWFLLAMLPRPIFIALREFLRANDRTEVFIRVQMLLSGMVLAITFGLTQFGMENLVKGIAIGSLLTLPLGFMIIGHYVKIQLFQNLLKLVPTIFAICAMALAVLGWRSSGWLTSNPWLSLSGSILIGATIYLAICLILQFREVRFLAATVSGMIRRHPLQSTSPF